MKKLYHLWVLSAILICAGAVKSQNLFEVITPFNQSVFVKGLTEDAWGNLLVYGETTIGGGPFGGGVNNLVLMKHKPDGTLLWTRYYTTPADQGIYEISLAAKDGFYAMAGFTMGAETASRDGLLILTDTAGTVVQTIRGDNAGGSNAFHSVVAAENGWVLSGRSDAGAGGSYDLQLINLQTDGTPVFAKTFGGSEWDWGYWAEPHLDGYVMTGYGDSFGGGWSDVFVVKTDAAGSPVWARTIATSSPDDGMFTTSDSQGNVYVTGYTLGMIPGNQDNKGFIAKISADGDLLWCKVISGWESIPSMCITLNDRIVVVGNATNASDGLGLQDIGFVLLSSEGDVLESYRYGSNATDYVNHVIALSDGALAIIGGTNGFGSTVYKPYLLKVSLTGEADCNSIPYDFPVTVAEVTFQEPVYQVADGLTNFDWSATGIAQVVASESVCCPVEAVASFSLIDNLIFENTSQNASEINWFVNGLAQPAGNTLDYNFVAGEVYEICLVASNECSTDEYCEIFSLDITAISGTDNSPFVLYPNPNNGQLRIIGQQVDNLTILDLNGRPVQDFGRVQPDANITLALPAGIYFARITNHSGTFTHKLVVR